uniref:Uncharacterized protein n=1 Tax=Anguilla anguilla TaxID=7936 RepID=A0A0E9SWN8_ANGAN
MNLTTRDGLFSRSLVRTWGRTHAHRSPFSSLTSTAGTPSKYVSPRGK